jgi:hypothetical protein
VPEGHPPDRAHSGTEAGSGEEQPEVLVTHTDYCSSLPGRPHAVMRSIR